MIQSSLPVIHCLLIVSDLGQSRNIQNKWLFYIQMETFLNNRKSLLFILAVGNTIAFATWQVLLNNFVVERAAFTGEEIGLLQSLREAVSYTHLTLPTKA